jgi:hypothetical protein
MSKNIILVLMYHRYKLLDLVPITSCFDQCGHFKVLKFLTRKLLFSVVVYVVKYIGSLDAHMYLSWWVVFSLVVCCAACLILRNKEQDLRNFVRD